MLVRLSEHVFFACNLGGYLFTVDKAHHKVVRMESSHRHGCSWEVVGYAVLLPWHMAENRSQMLLLTISKSILDVSLRSRPY